MLSIAAALLLLHTVQAFGQEAFEEEGGSPENPETIVLYPEEPRRPALPNIGVEVGAGFQTFTEELGDVTSAGLGYNLRFIFGPRSRLALEVGYLGGLAEAERTEVFQQTAVSVYSNSGEVLARLNFFGNRDLVRPFIAGGANFTRINSSLSTPIGTTELDRLNGLGFPLVGGVQFLPSENFLVSARANYNVLTAVVDDDFPPGNQWGAMLSAGAMF
jgi:opacity protein-like surface antigen